MIVTKMKGRWEIKVSPHKSNTVCFKVDKREQIVIVANSWVGATLGLGICNRFTAMVYNHVGIALPEGLENQYNSTETDTSQGCLIFYALRVSPTWDPAHVGIRDGTNIVDINCAAAESLHLQLPEEIQYVNKHPQAAIDDEYKGKQMRAPKELKDLDGE